jgi:hypothetical protein
VKVDIMANKGMRGTYDMESAAEWLFLATPNAGGANADAEAIRRLKATAENFMVDRLIYSRL